MRRGRCWLRIRRFPPLQTQPRGRSGPTCRCYEPDSREPPRSAERWEQHPAVGAGHLRRPQESKSGDAGTPRSAGGDRWQPPELRSPQARGTCLFSLPFLTVPAASPFAPFPVHVGKPELSGEQRGQCAARRGEQGEGKVPSRQARRALPRAAQCPAPRTGWDLGSCASRQCNPMGSPPRAATRDATPNLQSLVPRSPESGGRCRRYGRAALCRALK